MVLRVLPWMILPMHLVCPKKTIYQYFENKTVLVEESVMYLFYVMLVTFVANAKIYSMQTPLTDEEILMWILNVGFVIGEITQMVFEGVGYLTDAGNIFDNFVMVNWAVLALIRMGCELMFSECDASDENVTEEEYEDGDFSKGLSRNQPAVIIYTTIWTLQLTILWSRICLIFVRSRNS